MKKIRLLLAGLSVAGLCLLPAVVSADANDFTINNFSADETLSRADPQGELHVVERINLTYSGYNHGILRAIPKSYKHHSLQLHINRVTSDSGAPAQFTTSSSSGNTVLKIGDPNRTITGPQEYTIDYTLRNVISFYKDHSELYWDVNGDQWQQSFDTVSATVHLPADLAQTRVPLCYGGDYGQTGVACNVQTGTNMFKASIVSLQPHQMLTYAAAFQPGYFHPFSWYDAASQYAGAVLKLALLPVLAFIYAFSRWWYRGRDPRGSGVIVPQYDPPDRMTPLELGTLMKFEATNQDVTATIVDLAVRRYVKIIESKQKKALRKDELEYALELINQDFSGLNGDEVKLLGALFSQPTVGRQAILKKASSRLYDLSKSLREAAAQRLTEKGYFQANPINSNAGLGILAVAAFFGLFILGSYLGAAIVIGLIISLVILVGFMFIMPARTAKGVAALEHGKGLRLYLNVAEKDRIRKLQGPDAPYAASSSEPTKTVELFETLLPYAMVLGVEKQWAKQFEGLYTSPPDWYSGNWATFNAVYLASSLNNGIGAAVNTSFSASASSGSSGFGGGGFAGGGGGGGGGGGW